MNDGKIEKRKESKTRNLITRFRGKDELIQIRYAVDQKDDRKR